jgi:hypothetical protein
MIPPALGEADGEKYLAQVRRFLEEGSADSSAPALLRAYRPLLVAAWR